MLPGEVDVRLWTRCSESGCGAARMEPAGTCLGHLEAADLDHQLARFGRGRPLDARGVVFSDELLERVLRAAALDGIGRRKLSPVRFDGATFEADVVLDHAWFGLDASFRAATFRGRASFREARVLREASFAQATFTGEARFDGAQLEGPTNFSAARFPAGASFAATTFGGPAWFTDAAFGADAVFTDASFGRHASFQDAGFGCHGHFGATNFEADVEFAGSRFANPPDFTGAFFKGREGLPEVATGSDTQWWGPPLATWGQRAKAALWDFMVPLAMIVGSLIAAALLRALDHEDVASLLPWVAWLAVIAYWVRLAWIQGDTGQSPGKARVGLRLLDEGDRRAPGPGRGVARQLAHVLDTVTVVGWLLPLRDPKARTIADRVMGTVVVVVGEQWQRANRDEPEAATAAAGFG